MVSELTEDTNKKLAELKKKKKKQIMNVNLSKN